MPSGARQPKNWTNDEGSASLEFIVAGLVLLVPVVYLVVVLFQIQAAILAAEGGARQAARVFAQSTTADAGTRQASTAVEFSLADQGLDPSAATVTVSCADGGPEDCLDPRDLVSVAVHVDVALPLAPPILGLDDVAVVPVDAVAVSAVSDFHVVER